MRVCFSFMLICLLAAAIPAFGQQVGPASPGSQSDCLLAPALRSLLPATIDAEAAQLCKPVSRTSNAPPVNPDPQKDAGRYFVIDVPGATEGTYPTDMNSVGEVTGYFVDNNFGWHGFVFTPDGKPIQKFDPPGSHQTFTGSINSLGTVVGYYADAQFVFHGFLRTRQGVITSFDLPPGWQPTSIGSNGPSINDSGWVAGSIGNRQGSDGYLRSPSGEFTLFQALNTGTSAPSLNASNTVAGTYFSNQQGLVFHGYVRDFGGVITPFDVPGAAWTFVTSHAINSDGVVTGYYQTADKVAHGYVRDKNGTITTFDVPGGGSGEFQGTGLWAMAINDVGRIAGTYVDSNDVTHGFVRDVGGKITTFDFPGAVSSGPATINSAGVILGGYADANNINHGFVRISLTAD